ncbi:lipase family protein [Antrihabitans stalactiti]|uniref:lipase family protein n=1 Tax=Antrihabitans stalactiti TaxID=2584121 RepID=UPI001F0D5322|nr:lipase family protein [Antrihabitans stalactiti]
MATDYAGLGTPGVHPYLDGPSEAHSLIDGVRAARAVDPRLSTKWAATGYSQGGHATLFAAHLANATAPDLDYRGGVAIAPPTRLERLLPLAGPYVPKVPFSGTTTFFALILTALRAAHPELNLDSYLTPHGVEVLDGLEETCYADAEQKLNIGGIGDLLSRPLNDPALVSAFRQMVEVPTSGYDRPLMLAQGLNDDVVPPPLTADFGAELIANGVDVTIRVYPDNHLDTVFSSQPDAIAFMHKIFDKP